MIESHHHLLPVILMQLTFVDRLLCRFEALMNSITDQ
jgi:hypothetical protein